jgi:hypothetical protein
MCISTISERYHQGLGGEIIRPIVPEATTTRTSAESHADHAATWADDAYETGDERASWFPEAKSWAAFARFMYAAGSTRRWRCTSFAQSTTSRA